MKFQEFWTILQDKLKQEEQFKIKRGGEFRAYFDRQKNGELFVQVTPTSGKPRGRIRANEFQGVWNNAKGYSRETRFINEGGRLWSYTKKDGKTGKTAQLSYIVALINHVVKDQEME